MPPQEDKSRIEELKKSLYSRNAPDVRTRRKLRFTDRTSDVKTSWERPVEERPDPVLSKAYEDHSMSFFTKLLIGSAVFCIVAVGIGALLFFKGANLISADNIDIQISGPVSISGGEPVTFDIVVLNKNNVDLQVADLSVEFPAGTTDALDPTTELRTHRELLGDIPAGRSVKTSVSAIIFGEENLQKQIAVTVTYSVKGSTSVFTKLRMYDVLIKSSPINVTVSSFREIASGQEFELKVNLKSNSAQTLKSVILKAAYPFGFTFVSSDLRPLSDNATWRVGDIPAGGERNIAIRGKLQGEDGDLRVFRFAVGAQSSGNTQVIGTEYASIEQHITIEKPFISLGLSIDNDSGSDEYVARYNQPVRVRVDWFNNLPVTVSNMQISVKLSGNAYDAGSVQPQDGVFRSSSGEITWNQQTSSNLRAVGAGESGNVSFTVIPKDRSTVLQAVVDPSLLVTASVSGNRTQEARVPEALSSAVSRSIRIASVATLSGRILRTIGTLTNTGPIPPKVDQVTTYTVVWTVDNTSSALEKAKVVATLPAYVEWRNVKSPAGEDITYEPNSGLVTWNIGAVGTHTVGSPRRREVLFQVALQPGAHQVGQSPTIVDRSIFSAVDSFTGADVQSIQESLTTRFSTDPAYREGNQTVVR